MCDASVLPSPLRRRGSRGESVPKRHHRRPCEGRGRLGSQCQGFKQAPAFAGATIGSRIVVKKSLSYSVPVCFILFDDARSISSPDFCRTRRCTSGCGGYYSTGRE